MEVADEELALVVLGLDASVDARGEELVEAEEEDALAVVGHALGGFDGEERLARAGAAVDDDALGVVEDVEGDALLFGEVVELLADVVDDELGGRDEVEVAAEEVGELFDGVGLERGAFLAGLGGAGEVGEAVDVGGEGFFGVAAVVDEAASDSGLSRSKRMSGVRTP